LARQRVGSALFPVDDAHRRAYDETGVTGCSDRLEEGSAGRDDVFDEAHRLAFFERPLDAVRRPILLRRVTDHDERQAGDERGRGGKNDASEHRRGEPHRVGLVLGDDRGDPLADRGEQVGTCLEAVLVEVERRPLARAEDEVTLEVRSLDEGGAELVVVHGPDASRVTVLTPLVQIGLGQLPKKFFADRGTHLAAMVAYFALLSFVPLIFLALALFGLAHRADAGFFFVKELKRTFPGTSLKSIVKLVHQVQDNAAALGIIGGVGLLWSSLSMFSALESALNIVYGLPNRRFLHGKGLAAGLMSSMIVTLFASLVVGSLGFSYLRDNFGFARSAGLAYVVSVGVSTLGVLLFLLAVYRWLPNTPVDLREALPGAVLGAIALEVSFQVLPVFVRYADVNVTLRTLGGPAILLLWLYVMANLLVFGGEVNWWWRERRRALVEEPAPPAPGAS
jgi:membrane protein